METTTKNTNKRLIIIISIITSLTISILLIGGVGYFIYHKYLKINVLQKLVNDHLKGYVDSGNLNDLIITKLEQYTGGKVTIGDISLDNEQGLLINNLMISKDEYTISIKDANMAIHGGISLNNIILNDVAINLASEITVQNSQLNAEKVIIKYNISDILKGNLLIKGVTVLSPELSMVRRENGVWLIMDMLKDLTDKFNLDEYTDLLADGVTLKNGAFHFIDKDFFSDGVLNLSGIDMVIKPFSGSLKDLRINGVVHDDFFGNYNITGKMDLNIPALSVRVNAKDIAISENFTKKIPVIGETCWNSYKPNGKIGLDCLFNFNNDAGKRQFDRLIKINCTDIEATYYKWPITASRITGNILVDNNKITINNANGYVFDDGQNGTNVKLDIILELGKPAKKIIVKAYDVDLTKELVSKTPDSCKKLYNNFKLGGRADLEVIYTVSDDGAINKDYKIELDCKDWHLTYPDIPIPLKNVNGKIVISNRTENGMLGKSAGTIQLKDLKGYLDDGQQMAAINFSGEFDMGSPKSLFYINVPDLNLSNDILEKLPKKYNNFKKNYTAKGKIEIDIVYDNMEPDTLPDISVNIDCKGCYVGGSMFPLPIHNINGTVKIKGNLISADNFVGKCYGGNVNGTIQMDTGDTSIKYTGDFKFDEIDMEQLFKTFFKTNQEWPGLLSGKIKFDQGGKNQNKLNANGYITLKEGNISDVPIALSIIKILNFGLPTKVVFHSGRINFFIKNNMIEITEAKIYSDTLELVAKGRVSFDGRLDITVIVEFTKNTLRDIPVFGPLFDFVIGGVRKKLTKIHVGGTISEPESHLAMLKPIKKPIESVFDLFSKDNEDAGTSTVGKPKKKK
ncbi:MAG: hypothetical protein ACUZ8O_16715 [Candidatus Anammoxibacter sp.]